MEVASVLFSAGRGNRLRPLTDVSPKPVLPLLDIPLGAFGLTRLVSAAAPTVVNVRHLAREVTRSLGPWSRGPKVEFVEESPEAYGTAGTLAFLKERIELRVVTLNSDLLNDIDIDEMLALHVDSGASATLAVRRVGAGADIELASDDSPTGFLDRRAGPTGPGALFLGAGVFERRALNLIPPIYPVGLAEGLIAPLIQRKEVNLYFHPGYALDVGTMENYLLASIDLVCGFGPPPPRIRILGEPRLEGWPGEFVPVDGGQAFIGEGASASFDALGDGAVILHGASVGEGAWVKRSIVWPGEHIPPGTLLEDSVWAFGVAHRP